MSGPLVSADWLIKNFYDPNVVILDASQKDNKAGLKTEFENIQISGARYFDLANTFSDESSDLPNMLPAPEVFEAECRKMGINAASKIVAYDNLGVYSSPRVWWMFKIMGHGNVAVLDGGLRAWAKIGGQVELFHSRTFDRGDFKANYNPAGVKDVDDIVSNLKTKEAVVLDARSEGRFSGEAPEPRKELPSGHIPGSFNLPFKRVLNDLQFRSKDELVTLFRELNLEDRPLIFSCGSGLTACITLLAAELVLENPTSVFDGSWTEWAQSENLPIANKSTE